MKLGNTGLNLNKKIDSKFSTKSNNIMMNTQNLKEIKNKYALEGLKKSFAKGKLKI